MKMPTVAERVSVLETQIINIGEKIDDLKNDVRDNRENIMDELKSMSENSAKAHGELHKKICEIEDFKNKWYYLLVGAAAVISFLLGHMNLAQILFK